MANPHNVELEAAKFLQKLIQDSKDEPTKLATKLYVILQHMRASGKENSLSYQVISMAMETLIKQYGLDIEDLTSSRLPPVAGTQIGESGPSQGAGSSQRVGVAEDPKASLTGNELIKPEAYSSGRTLVSPCSSGHGKAAQVYKGRSCASGLHQTKSEMPWSAIYLSPARECPTYEMTALMAFNQEVPNRISNNEKETTQVNESLQTREMMQLNLSFQQSVVTSTEQEGTTGSLKKGLDNSSAKGILDVKSLSKIQNSRLKVTTPVSPSQQSIMVVNNMSRGNVVTMEQDMATGPRNQVTARTLDQEYGINRAVLEHHSGKKLEDVADILGLSRSTLKRICRKHHIFRWPPCKAKKDKRSLQKLVQATRRNISGRNHRSSDLSAPQAQMTSDAKIVGDDGRVMIKATYRDDIFKFQLSLSSTKLDLEKEISLRLKLSVGSFKTKYLDEDDDWISLACDADLRTCIRTSTSLGRATIKMLVDQI